MPETVRLTLRLPAPMAAEAAALAQAMGISLNAYLTLAVDSANRYHRGKRPMGPPARTSRTERP